jgi:hypothetical protein
MESPPRKETRWARIVPVVVVLAVVAALAIWYWGPWGPSSSSSEPEGAAAADEPASPEATGGPDPASLAEVPPEEADTAVFARRDWERVLGEVPAWPSDLLEPGSCSALRAETEALCALLDSRESFRGAALEGGACGLLSRAGSALAARPPIVAGETKELELLLGNVFHFFRVLGEDRIHLMRRALREEEALAEPLAFHLFRWAASRPRCGEGAERALASPVLYDYGIFLLRTLGGQAYLRRRAPRVEALATFYALVVLDDAVRRGHDPEGIDLLTDIRRCHGMLAGQDLVFRDRYLRVLDEMDAFWTAR